MAMERRMCTRYMFQAPAVMHWDEAGTRRQQSARTRDVSASGAYLVSDICPPCDAVADLKIPLTTSHSPAPSYLKGRMRVMRVDHFKQETQACGFALEGDILLLPGTSNQNLLAMDERPTEVPDRSK